jgi:hypothetical protein
MSGMVRFPRLPIASGKSNSPWGDFSRNSSKLQFRDLIGRWRGARFSYILPGKCESESGKSEVISRARRAINNRLWKTPIGGLQTIVAADSSQFAQVSNAKITDIIKISNF